MIEYGVDKILFWVYTHNIIITFVKLALNSLNWRLKEREVIIMPQRNGTGPTGQGPLTGRGMGPCGDGKPKTQGPGLGLGRGRGRGFRWFWQKKKDDQADQSDQK